MTPPNILKLLRGGDRRSIGRSDEVAAQVTKDPRLFPQLIAGLWNDDPVIRIRAADAAEKVTREHPELLAPFKQELLGLAAETDQHELRWHLAAMIPRLPLEAHERNRAISILKTYLDDKSSIVKTFALQALADLTRNHKTLRSAVIGILESAIRTGTPAMKARSRKLLKSL
ncbi:MAG: hypothetical protein JOZ43_08980 [Acidobacteriales bacterium]|nr:hypothetical protein [Terriglobales bacterium]